MAFYDRDPRDDRRHDVALSVKRPGLRVLHASAYAFPSKSIRRQSEMTAAYLTPALFSGGDLHAGIVPVTPLRDGKWSCNLVLDFPVSLAGGVTSVQRELGAVLRKGPDVVHRFDRRVEVRAKTDSLVKPDRVVSFQEPITLEAGKYQLTAVLADPAEGRPAAFPVEFEIERVPKASSFVVGPILGRKGEGDLVIQSQESTMSHGTDPAKDRVAGEGAFRPLLTRRFEGDEPLVALTQVCARPEDPPKRVTLQRTISPEGGPVIGRLTNFEFTPDPSRPIDCRSTLDPIPLELLPPGGYRLQVFLGADAGMAEEAGSVRFERAP